MEHAGLLFLCHCSVFVFSSVLLPVSALQSGSPERVFAVAGEDVVLPCHFNPSISPSPFGLTEWSRVNGPSLSTVHVVRNGEELEKETTEEYRGRTAVAEDGSLMLRSGTRRDSGTYRCFRRGGSSVTVFVSLIVAQVSEVNVTVRELSNELVVHCECSSWGLKPRVSLLDAEGNVLPAENESSVEPGDLYSVRAHLGLAKGKSKKSGIMVCQAEITELRLVKEKRIDISEKLSVSEAEVGPGYTVVAIVLLVVAVVVIAVVVIVVLNWKVEKLQRLRAFCTRLVQQPLRGEEAQPLLKDIDIAQVNTTGASEITAKAHHVFNKDQLLDGVKVSQQLAERDLDEMNKYKDIINSVGESENIPPSLLAGIICRQSQAGTKLDQNGFGLYDSNCFGLMQIHKLYNRLEGGPFSKEHVEQGARIIARLLQIMQKERKNWTTQQHLKGALACYIAGEETVLNLKDHEDVDSATPCNDFANDVIARARWFAMKGFKSKSIKIDVLPS
ncbi:selection and upkeep of intraepithelial T-cells protein 5-like isoform X1 [Seriola dumerili]|nr:selection and upkeep of intraepithelial T-cells protein 5-like isoform X1 [Seriola dumerili]